MLKTGEYIFDGKTKFEILKNKYANNIKKETDDLKLNDLIKKLVVIDPHKRMEWDDYFKDPFFINKKKRFICKANLIGDPEGKRKLTENFIKTFKKQFKQTITPDFFTKEIYLEKEQSLVIIQLWDTAAKKNLVQ